MRRSVPLVICVCLFTLASGMTVIALAQDVNRPLISGRDRPSETAATNTELVRRLYAEVEAVLATGDAALLDPFVSPDLVEHPVRPGAAAGRDGFVHALLALRATFPGLTLVVDDVRAAGEDQVLARVHTTGAEYGAFLGGSVPASFGQLGPLEVWRIADGQLVERWGGLASAALLPLGQALVSVDALGPGHRRLTVTRVTVEPGATLPVDNGQAIRIFAIESGVLTVAVAERSREAVALAHGPGAVATSASATTFAAGLGDRVVTAPEAGYRLKNAGPSPVIMLVVIVSNTLEGDLSLNSSSAAASWTVAAMPEALGGVLPSPAGVSARVLAGGVEIDMPEESNLMLGWMFLSPGASFVLPAGDRSVVAAVVEGEADLASMGGGHAAHLESGEWMVIRADVEHLWQARANNPTAVVMLAVG